MTRSSGSRRADLSLISNDAAVPGKGVGKLFDATLVSHLTASHIGLNPKAQQQMLANQIAVDLIPQGPCRTHSRGRLRSGRRAHANRRRHLGGRRKAPDRGERNDVSARDGTAGAIRAGPRLSGDYLGNLTYALTARNFNPVMAMAADTVIVTAEHIVPVGVIAPDHVVTPAPLVDYLITNG